MPSSPGALVYTACQPVVAVSKVAATSADIFKRSGDMVCHQVLDMVDVKQAMFESSTRRILLAGYTKFGKRALHALMPLTDVDAVVGDAVVGDGETDPSHVARLRAQGVTVVAARRPPSAR